jgi:hypothetical protein
MSESILINNIPPELLEDNPIIINGDAYAGIISKAQILPKSRTPYPATNLQDTFKLVQEVIRDRERRENTNEEAKIIFTEEEPDYKKSDAVTIVFSLQERLPGAFGHGKPMGLHTVKNLRPILREEIDDPENPGYKRAILGYFHDNEIKFTVFARTNKVANAKALWFEEIMQEYSWYFTSHGVARLFFLKRGADLVSTPGGDSSGQKLYGRPLYFYLRTETLTTISQKTLQQISVGAAKSPTPSLLNDV